MNYSNRVALTAVLVSGLYGVTYPLTREKLRMNITSNHTRAFSKDNLYTTRLDQSELNAWNEVIKEVRKFVTAHNPAPADDLLTKSITKLEQASNNLINTLKITYNTTFSGTNKTVNGTQADRQARSKEFLAIEKKVQSIEKNLKREPLFTFTKKEAQDVVASRKEARDMLLFLCPFIETTALKARNDIEKEVAKRLKK